MSRAEWAARYSCWAPWSGSQSIVFSILYPSGINCFSVLKGLLGECSQPPHLPGESGYRVNGNRRCAPHAISMKTKGNPAEGLVVLLPFVVPEPRNRPIPSRN